MMSAPLSAAIRAATLRSSFSSEAAAFPKLAQQKDDAVIIDVLIHIGTSFLNFCPCGTNMRIVRGDKEGVNAGRSED